jgi:preprotein translocase subunit SecF
MLRLFSNANYAFIEKRNTAYVLTVIALVISFGFGIYYQIANRGWLDYNVDFTGGTLMQVKFTAPVTEDELRHVAEQAVPGTELSRFGAENEFQLRAPQFSDQGGNTVDLLTKAIQTLNKPFDIVHSQAVGPKVGAELQAKALTAILLSLVATLVYLAIRFEWRFGLAAVIATAHDTILTLGFISIFRFDVSLTTVAAVLTVLGFSLHDTIIIFDRVREDLKKPAAKRMEFKDILNKAINETLPRTILTVVTTEATLLSLAVFGGPTISGFATIMFVGILLGAYSSIFVAAPVLYEIEKRWGDREKGKAKIARPERVGAAV